MRGDGLNAGEGEQRARGGKLSGEPGPWLRRDALKLSITVFDWSHLCVHATLCASVCACALMCL